MKAQIPICGSCGVIAPKNNENCGVCEASFEGNTYQVGPPPDGLMVVRLRGEFDCRSCGNKVALNHFSLDGYLCGSCGIEQRFDWDLWEEIIKHAHNTADLTGFYKPTEVDDAFWNAFAEEEYEDIARMFKSIGHDKSTLTKGNGSLGGPDYEVDVSPGNPLCSECHKPLMISLGDNVLKTVCEPCGHVNTFALWSEPEKYEGVVGVISTEDRTDASAVKTDQADSGAVIAIRCPNCNGALKVEQSGGVVQCPFCSTACHVPSRLLSKIKGKAIPKEPWWAVFSGKSNQRKAVEQRQERMAKTQQREAEHRRFEIEMEQSMREAQAASKKRNNIIFAVAIVITIVFFAVLYFFVF